MNLTWGICSSSVASRPWIPESELWFSISCMGWCPIDGDKASCWPKKQVGFLKSACAAFSVQDAALGEGSDSRGANFVNLFRGYSQFEIQNGNLESENVKK